MSNKGDKPEVQVLEVKIPEKAKKPRSEAQKAAAMKGLEILKAKREASAKEESAVNDAKVIAKEKVRNAKKANPGVDIVTRDELHKFMENVKTLVTKPDTNIPVQKEVKKKVKVVEVSSDESEEEVVVVKKKKEPRPVVVAPPVQPTPPAKLTGHALLDSIFFNK